MQPIARYGTRLDSVLETWKKIGSGIQTTGFVLFLVASGILFIVMPLFWSLYLVAYGFRIYKDKKESSKSVVVVMGMVAGLLMVGQTVFTASLIVCPLAYVLLEEEERFISDYILVLSILVGIAHVVFCVTRVVALNNMKKNGYKISKDDI